MSQVERVLEHELDESADVTTDLPAMLDERQRSLLEMQQTYELTVEPNVMRLPVKSVTTNDDTAKWSITVDHPITGDITLFVKKPETGWHEECEMAKLLEWYNINDQNPYKLQTDFLYVEYDEEKSPHTHGWRLVPPPWTYPEPTLMDRAFAWIGVHRPKRTILTMWASILTGVTLAPFVVAAAGVFGFTTAAIAVGVYFVAMFFSTIIGTMILDASGDLQ